MVSFCCCNFFRCTSCCFCCGYNFLFYYLIIILFFECNKIYDYFLKFKNLIFERAEKVPRNVRRTF